MISYLNLYNLSMAGFETKVQIQPLHGHPKDAGGISCVCWGKPVTPGFGWEKYATKGTDANRLDPK
jgi:hypothetical protein